MTGVQTCALPICGLAQRAGWPSLRLANLGRLKHNLSVDLYVDKVVAKARLVVARLLGGRGYWTYAVDQIVTACHARGIPVALLPGDDQPDAELAALSTLPPETTHRLWQYLVHGGDTNAIEFLRVAATAIGLVVEVNAPVALPRAGAYIRAGDGAAVPDSRPVAVVVFYRALVQAGDTAPIDALCDALATAGLRALPIYVASLKDPLVVGEVRSLLTHARPDVILNLTGFALSSRIGDTADPLTAYDCPVLQVVLSSESEIRWKESTRGLAPRDLAMNVALPEIDGRVLTRAIAFKDARARDAVTQADIVGYRPVTDRVAFVAELAAAWVRLRRAAPRERRVALVLANYPNRDGRIGNGVGLDTPESVVEIVQALGDAGYRVEDAQIGRAHV